MSSIVLLWSFYYFECWYAPAVADDFSFATVQQLCNKDTEESLFRMAFECSITPLQWVRTDDFASGRPDQFSQDFERYICSPPSLSPLLLAVYYFTSFPIEWKNQFYLWF